MSGFVGDYYADPGGLAAQLLRVRQYLTVTHNT